MLIKKITEQLKSKKFVTIVYKTMSALAVEARQHDIMLILSLVQRYCLELTVKNMKYFVNSAVTHIL